MSDARQGERPSGDEAEAGAQVEPAGGSRSEQENTTRRLSRQREDRLEQLRALGATEAVRRTGWQHTTDSRGRVTTVQCPGCGQAATRDRRGFHGADISRPKGTPDFWVHSRCGQSGGAIDVLMAHVWGRRIKHPTTEQWRELFDAAGRLGLIDGQESRRGGARSTSVAVPIRRSFARAAEEPPRYPPWTEVQTYWAAARSVLEDAAAAEQLRSRGFKPAMVDALGCVRATPEEVPTTAPTLARCCSWRRRHVVLFALCDVSGRLRAPHARDLTRGAARPKGLFLPEYNVRGLVFATERVRALLVGEQRAVEEVRHQGIRIVEGAPDFLSSALEHRFMFSLGVVSGSWPENSPFAKRIPDGTPVYIATQAFREDGMPDVAGRKYAVQIWKSFKGRRVQVFAEPGLLDGVATRAERRPGEEG